MEKEKRDKLLEKGQDFKGVHVPIMWKDAPVLPFRFNPKAEKQGEIYFVEMKAKLIPRLDTLGFVELLSEPTTTFPKYLLPKAKMSLLAAKRKARKEKSKKEQEKSEKKEPEKSEKKEPEKSEKKEPEKSEAIREKG